MAGFVTEFVPSVNNSDFTGVVVPVARTFTIMLPVNAGRFDPVNVVHDVPLLVENCIWVVNPGIVLLTSSDVTATLTVTAIVVDTPFAEVAVSVVDPRATPVTSPEEVTLATAGAALVHVVDDAVALEGTGDTCAVTVEPKSTATGDPVRAKTSIISSEVTTTTTEPNCELSTALAVMVVVPICLATIFPDELTVATDGSELLQMRDLLVA